MVGLRDHRDADSVRCLHWEARAGARCQKTPEGAAYRWIAAPLGPTLQPFGPLPTVASRPGREGVRTAWESGFNVDERLARGRPTWRNIRADTARHASESSPLANPRRWIAKKAHTRRCASMCRAGLNRRPMRLPHCTSCKGLKTEKNANTHISHTRGNPHSCGCFRRIRDYWPAPERRGFVLCWWSVTGACSRVPGLQRVGGLSLPPLRA